MRIPDEFLLEVKRGKPVVVELDGMTLAVLMFEALCGLKRPEAVSVDAAFATIGVHDPDLQARLIVMSESVMGYVVTCLQTGQAAAKQTETMQ